MKSIRSWQQEFKISKILYDHYTVWITNYVRIKMFRHKIDIDYDQVFTNDGRWILEKKSWEPFRRVLSDYIDYKI